MIDLAAIESLPLADSIRHSVWAYPILEAVHISGIAALVGALLVLELRVFGAQPALPLPPLGRLVVTIALSGFAIAASCGILMFISAATEIGRNPAFQVKLGLMLIAALNAGWFHARGSLRRHDGVARAQALLSLLLWLGVIFAGRLIAYV
jgi:hypothetical protein